MNMNVLQFKSVANIFVCSTAQSYLSILTHCFLSTRTELLSPHTEKPSLLEICQCKWWVPYDMQCTSCVQAPVWWVLTCILRVSSCWVRPSEEGTPKVLGLYFRNALSLLEALPTYHTLCLQDLQYYYCLLLLLLFLVKMSNFLLKFIQVPFQLKVYKFEHD